MVHVLRVLLLLLAFQGCVCLLNLLPVIDFWPPQKNKKFQSQMIPLQDGLVFNLATFSKPSWFCYLSLNSGLHPQEYPVEDMNHCKSWVNNHCNQLHLHRTGHLIGNVPSNMIISQAILETTIYKHHLAVLHVFVFGKSQEYRFGWFRFVAGMGPSLGGCFLLSFPGQCKRLYPWLRFEVREVRERWRCGK